LIPREGTSRAEKPARERPKLVPAHVFSAEDLGTAEKHCADGAQQHRHGTVEADNGHGTGADGIGGKEAGHNTVDRTDQTQKDLDRQKPEHQPGYNSGRGVFLLHGSGTSVHQEWLLICIVTDLRAALQDPR
jgi:hypothetical protein